MKSKLLLLLTFISTALCATTPAQKDAHWLATIQKSYREAALVMVADLSSDGGHVVIEPREVWKAAPGYVPGRITVPKDSGSSPGTYGPPQVTRSLVYFNLRGNISEWGGFTIENDRLVLFPNYTLSELRRLLDESVAKG